MNLWNRFWFSRQDPLPLAITRIGVGLIWLAFLAVTATSWHRYYGYDGILSLGDTDLNALRKVGPASVITLSDGVFDISCWWWIGLAMATCLTIGFQTRLATIGMFLFASALIQRAPIVVNGEEMVTRMLLLYGCFSPWGQRLSLDSLLQRNKNSDEELPLVWSWRMMQINFVLIYAISVPYKLVDDIDWLNGNALHWTVASDMWWTRGWMSDLTLGYGGILRRLLTWGTIFVEASFPILVCFRWTRLPITLAIMSLHLGIAYCIPGVTLFTLTMVAGATMFIPHKTYLALYNKLFGDAGCITHVADAASVRAPNSDSPLAPA